MEFSILTMTGVNTKGTKVSTKRTEEKLLFGLVLYRFVTFVKDVPIIPGVLPSYMQLHADPSNEW